MLLVQVHKGSPMITRLNSLISFLMALLFSISSVAGSPSLTIRQLDGSLDYEVVLVVDSHYCTQVTPASSVQVVGFEILVESLPTEQYPCSFVLPITYLERTAVVGSLEAGVYTVTWNQPGDFYWSESVLVRDDRFSSPIPAGSPWALILLVFGVMAIAYVFIHQRKQPRELY